MQFQFSLQPFIPEIFGKLLKAIAAGIEKADFDSGWIAAPTGNVVKHTLGQLPSEVWVYKSASSTGEGFSPDAYTSITRTTVTVSGAGAYYRIRMNKGA